MDLKTGKLKEFNKEFDLRSAVKVRLNEAGIEALVQQRARYYRGCMELAEKLELARKDVLEMIDENGYITSSIWGLVRDLGKSFYDGLDDGHILLNQDDVRDAQPADEMQR